MKRNVMGVMIACALTALIPAQTPQDARIAALEARVKERWRDYEIGVPYLDDERREKLTPLFRTMFTPPKDGETRDFAKVREDMQKVRDETMTEMKTLLSVDQAEAFEKQEQSRRGGWGMGGGRRSSNNNNR